MTPLPDHPHLGSTYRLQLHGLGFTGATRLVGYLDLLGIETLYCSPLLAATPGTSHGYDVVDPTRLHPELGTAEEFEALLAELAAHDMRLLIDIVPNHLATDAANRWWWDVLRLGPTSAYAPVFDIDWEAGGGRVLVPALPRPLHEALGDGSPAVVELDSGPVIEFSGQTFPLDPGHAPAAGKLSTSEATDVLSGQHYRPAYWRLAGDEGNYRRFFDIDGLAGVRVEDPAVFDATHALVLELGSDERVAGFRVDHIDGLAAPAEYLSRLRRLLAHRRHTAPVVVVEKILGPGEELPTRWEADGTTGYEFADLAGALFLDGAGAATVRAADDPSWTFDASTVAAKHQVLGTSFGASLDRVARLAIDALTVTRPGHDLSRACLRRALAELTVHMAVYRTYLEDGPDKPSTRRVTDAADAAWPLLDGEARRAMGELVAGLRTGGPAWRECARRWQQLSGAVMAKGVEDTAGYRAVGLLGHAEVGSSPDRPGVTQAQFAAAMVDRLQRHPLSLNTTSTHDSKRSEDVRTRLYALSEWGPEWRDQVTAWRDRHAGWINEHGGPRPQMVHTIYQTLVAMWPIDGHPPDGARVGRIADSMVKAAREAKTDSSWDQPDEAYEAAVVAFVRFLASDDDVVRETARWAARTGPAAATSSLALTILKVACPGVPDTYQGNEVWEQALTDPDNRRPVDFDLRSGLLRSLTESPDPPALLRDWSDGRIKLHVLRSMLAWRRTHPDLSGRGALSLLAVEGPARDHVVALARTHGDEWLIAVVPRLTRQLGCDGAFALGAAAWGQSTIRVPPGSPPVFTDLLGGTTLRPSDGALRLAEVLERLPVAALVG